MYLKNIAKHPIATMTEVISDGPLEKNHRLYMEKTAMTLTIAIIARKFLKIMASNLPATLVFAR